VLRRYSVGREPVVVVNHRAAGEPANEQRTGQKENAEVPETLKEGCHQVTYPFPTPLAAPRVDPQGT
jgi:hypothetical protein